MRIGYFADGPWSHRAIEKLVVDDNIDVVFIVPRYESQDSILKNWSVKLGIPFLPTKDVNEPSFISSLRGYNAELFVSMSFNQILKSEIISTPPLGFINCHAGELPYYRGRNVLNWVLINGEDHFGVTVHYVDEGVDTGDIIKQNIVEILPEDNYGTILEKAYLTCADTLVESLKDIAGERVQTLTQADIHPVGFYCGGRGPGDEIIDWSWSLSFHFVDDCFTQRKTTIFKCCLLLVCKRQCHILARRNKEILSSCELGTSGFDLVSCTC